MNETSLDRVITEERFAGVLAAEAEMLFRLANSLESRPEPAKRRLQLYQLGIEADLVEAFLDDHGAKHNQAYVFLRELVASLRGFAGVGFALEHLWNRLDGYATLLSQEPEVAAECRASIDHARGFVFDALLRLLGACREEAGTLGVQWGDKLYPEDRAVTGVVNLRLPNNLGDELLDEEDLKVAAVASKYLQVCDMFAQVGIRRVHDAGEREEFLAKICTEERARVYEATVHNLQSSYDTYLKGTGLEARDERLPLLRGHASAAFHLLEAVTGLVHFVERHGGGRVEGVGGRMEERIARKEVRDITLNHLLYWAEKVLCSGERLAREILSSVSRVEELVLEIPDGLTIHARPASLIVAVVNRYEMPVEMEIEESSCNAASILEVLICAGSNPESRTCRFRGDARPLADLKALFQAGLGEGGLDGLPPQLGYLQG